MISMRLIHIALKIVDGAPVEAAGLFHRIDLALPYIIWVRERSPIDVGTASL